MRGIFSGVHFMCSSASLRPWLSDKRCAHSDAIKRAFAECESTTAKYDTENHQWIRRLPVRTRAPMMVIRALNAETSLIGDIITQGGPPLRQMRFQWWRDAVQSAYDGKPVNHPVILALSYSLQIQPLSKYRIQRLISSKEADQVEHRPPSTIQQLEEFAESTASQLQYLQLEAAGIQDKDADHAASHLGKAVGIANLLRGTPALLARGVSYLPLDLCARHGISTEALYGGTIVGSSGMREVIYEMASTAHGHLEESVDLHGKGGAVPVEARRVFLSSVACKLYLDALQRCNFDVFDSRLKNGGFSPFWYALKLAAAHYRPGQ